MKEKSHSQTIPSTVLAEAQSKVNEIQEILSPFVYSLTPAERHEIPKMGEKSLSFVEKSFDFARQNPNLVPPYLDIDGFGIDFANAHGLWTLLNSVQQVEQNINDTEMIAGSEAYQSALVFYKSTKVAAATDVPGAKAVFEELKSRFPGGKRKSSDSSETVTETNK
ncbi:MAG: hypothetical protein LBS86_02020 [Treponema sp.]|jgi:hypothetical protein|nr:hypothetical protein [Treponema sp.]